MTQYADGNQRVYTLKIFYFSHIFGLKEHTLHYWSEMLKKNVFSEQERYEISRYNTLYACKLQAAVRFLKDCEDYRIILDDFLQLRKVEVAQELPEMISKKDKIGQLFHKMQYCPLINDKALGIKSVYIEIAETYKVLHEIRFRVDKYLNSKDKEHTKSKLETKELKQLIANCGKEDPVLKYVEYKRQYYKTKTEKYIKFLERGDIKISPNTHNMMQQIEDALYFFKVLSWGKVEEDEIAGASEASYSVDTTTITEPLGDIREELESNSPSE